jgi:hypothetical protein
MMGWWEGNKHAEMWYPCGMAGAERAVDSLKSVALSGLSW